MVALELLSGVRQSGESDKAVIACNDWLRLGAGRTLPELLQKYTDSIGKLSPTGSLATLRKWSMEYTWADRGTEYDATQEAIKNAERTRVMTEGLALDYERTDELKRLALFLLNQIYETGESGVHHNVWLPDVKQIGSGDTAERVDLEKFNAPILTVLLKTFEDLASETGGRIKRTDVTTGGAPIIFESGMSLDEL